MDALLVVMVKFRSLDLPKVSKKRLYSWDPSVKVGFRSILQF